MTDINAIDAGGMTQLHHAVQSGNKQQAIDLLDMGASPITVDSCGKTALELACRLGQYSVVFKMLHGCNFWPDALLRDMLHKSLVSTMQPSAIILWYGTDQPIHSIVKLLIAVGADPTIPTKRGETILEVAAKCGADDLVKSILRDHKFTHEVIQKAFLGAIRSGPTSDTPVILKCLYEYGADPIALSHNTSPLQHAQMWGEGNDVSNTIIDLMGQSRVSSAVDLSSEREAP